jgi:hypothetical protein
MRVLTFIINAIGWVIQFCVTVICNIMAFRFRRDSAQIGSSAGSMTVGVTKRNVVVAVCGVVLVASLVRMLMMFHTPSPKTDLHPYEALGKVCAEETTKLLSGRGEVVVIRWARSRVRMPEIEVVYASFKSALRKTGHVSIRATEEMVSPLSVSPAGMAAEPLTADRLAAIVRKYPGIQGIVSFIGVPALKTSDIEQWPLDAPKLVIVGAHDPEGKLGELLRKRIAAFAILPRFDAVSNSAKKPATDRDWFDQNFRILLPDPAKP